MSDPIESTWKPASSATAIGATAGPVPGTTYVVGEIGPSFVYGGRRQVNEHTLVRMLDAIADAGADAAKVQLKALDGFYVGDDLTKPPYDPMRAPFATRGEYVRAREPDRDLLCLIDVECRARGIEWTASPWDETSCAMLERFDPPWVKIASACLTDDALLRRVREMGSPRIVLSTGMSTRDEIDHAVEVLGVEGLTLAVCTASYPATIDMLHLARIRSMRARYGVPVGWSSHSADPDHPALAVAAGACWVEAHVTSGRARWGPDHGSSLTIDDFREMTWRVRECERALGRADLGVLPCEETARARLRRPAR